MKTFHTIVIAVLMMALTIAPALAGHHYNGMGHGCMMNTWDMNKLDANQDQSITFDEYSSNVNAKLKMGFDMVDADKDGVISADEWNTFLTVHGVQTES